MFRKASFYVLISKESYLSNMVPSSKTGKMKIKTRWFKRRRQVCSQAEDVQGRAVAFCAGTPGQFHLILSQGFNLSVGIVLTLLTAQMFRC